MFSRGKRATLRMRVENLYISVIVDVDFWTWAALIARKHVILGIEICES